MSRSAMRPSLPCATVIAMVVLSPACFAKRDTTPVNQPVIGSLAVPVLTVSGLTFRDLDRDGRLSPFEDWRLPAVQRAHDVVARMTLAEKAGALVHDAVPVSNGSYDNALASARIADGHKTSFITRLSGDGRTMASGSNRLRELAEQTRLAIPLTVSTDPRSHFQVTTGASVAAGGFSQWPETTGLAALADASLVEKFANIARQEYRAAGIDMILGPQADIASEARWPRINGTFGDQPKLVSRLATAYVRGFQNGQDGLALGGIPAEVKHWVGYGASDGGYDGHNFFGRFATMSAASLKLHQSAFAGAFQAGVAGVMPAYSILRMRRRGSLPEVGVAVAFDSAMTKGRLRKSAGFEGLVLSDWGITADCSAICKNGFPEGQKPTLEGFCTAWGMEAAPKLERFARAMNAGIDQFGGTSDGSPIVEAVNTGRVSQERLDAAVHQVMVLKFKTGLFENPFVDVDQAGRIVGHPDFLAAGLRAQSEAMVMLKDSASVLPLAARTKVYFGGVAEAALRSLGLVPVGDPAGADVAIIRLAAPFDVEHKNFYYSAKQHEGSLAYKADDAELQKLRAISRKVPTIAVVYLDRAALIAPIVQAASTVLAAFGASDEAVLSALAGKVQPGRHLPIELPADQAAVDRQRSDLPHDSIKPLFRTGYGQKFPRRAMTAKRVPK